MLEAGRPPAPLQCAMAGGTVGPLEGTSMEPLPEGKLTLDQLDRIVGLLPTADERLIVTGQDAERRETAEVVHEALIQRWGRLQAWMESDRAFRTWAMCGPTSNRRSTCPSRRG